MLHDDSPTQYAIVTVAGGSNEELLQTRTSIEGQLYPNWRHIVIAPANRSDLQEMAASFRPKPRLVQDEGRGVYEAMNRAFECDLYDYVIFLNSGDAFLDPQSLRAIDSATANMPEWLIAGWCQEGSSYREFRSPRPLRATTRDVAAFRQTMCHQGTVIRSDFLRKVGKFDESYRIAADYEWALRASGMASPAVLARPVVLVDDTGISRSKPLRTVLDMKAARDASASLPPSLSALVAIWQYARWTAWRLRLRLLHLTSRVDRRGESL